MKLIFDGTVVHNAIRVRTCPPTTGLSDTIQNITYNERTDNEKET